MGNDITKMKIFADIDGCRLEKAINDFMKDKFVYDIKVTSLAVTTEDGPAVNDRVFILYEDRYEEEIQNV